MIRAPSLDVLRKMNPIEVGRLATPCQSQRFCVALHHRQMKEMFRHLPVVLDDYMWPLQLQVPSHKGVKTARSFVGLLGLVLRWDEMHCTPISLQIHDIDVQG